MVNQLQLFGQINSLSKSFYGTVHYYPLNLFIRRCAVVSWLSGPTSTLRFFDSGLATGHQPNGVLGVGLSQYSPLYLHGHRG